MMQRGQELLFFSTVSYCTLVPGGGGDEGTFVSKVSPLVGRLFRLEQNIVGFNVTGGWLHYNDGDVHHGCPFWWILLAPLSWGWRTGTVVGRFLVGRFIPFYGSRLF